MGKNSGSGSGMNNPDHISESLEKFFGLKYLNSLMRIGDRGSGIEKVRIRNTEWNLDLQRLALLSIGTVTVMICRSSA
jgi:hypothetical protein